MCNFEKYLKNHTNYSISLGWKFHIIQAHCLLLLLKESKDLWVFLVNKPRVCTQKQIQKK